MNFQVDDTRAAASGEDVGTRSVRSLWRYPSKPCNMPDYLRRAFRMKCFALVTLQLLCVFLIKMVVDHYRPWHEILDYGPLTYIREEIFFYTSGVGTLLCIAAMQCLREQYPWNYLMIGVTTLLAGFFWGIMRSVVLTSMHFQILGILTVTMAMATALSRLSLNDVAMPLLRLLMPGWVIGSLSCVVVTLVWLEEPDQRMLLPSIGLAMVLLVILGLDAGTYLKECKPDDFMKVVVSMNSTLMVVVSIPFFILSFCFVHANEAMTVEVDRSTGSETEAARAPRPAASAAPPAPEPRGSRVEPAAREEDLEQGVEVGDMAVARTEQTQEDGAPVYVVAA